MPHQRLPNSLSRYFGRQGAVKVRPRHQGEETLLAAVVPDDHRRIDRRPCGDFAYGGLLEPSLCEQLFSCGLNGFRVLRDFGVILRSVIPILCPTHVDKCRRWVLVNSRWQKGGGRVMLPSSTDVLSDWCGPDGPRAVDCLATIGVDLVSSMPWRKGRTRLVRRWFMPIRLKRWRASAWARS